MASDTRHPDFPAHRLPQKLIHSLVEEPETKQILENLYTYHKQTVDNLKDLRNSPDVPDWFRDLITADINTRNRKVKRYHRLLMINTKNYTPTNEHTFDLDTIKLVPIEDLVTLVSPRTTTNRVTALCPFHQENTASFVVFKDTNHAHCFGCGFHGDNIAVVMKLHDLDFINACKFIQNH